MAKKKSTKRKSAKTRTDSPIRITANENSSVRIDKIANGYIVTSDKVTDKGEYKTKKIYASSKVKAKVVAGKAL